MGPFLPFLFYLRPAKDLAASDDEKAMTDQNGVARP